MGGAVFFHPHLFIFEIRYPHNNPGPPHPHPDPGSPIPPGEPQGCCKGARLRAWRAVQTALPTLQRQPVNTACKGSRTNPFYRCPDHVHRLLTYTSYPSDTADNGIPERIPAMLHTNTALSNPTIQMPIARSSICAAAPMVDVLQSGTRYRKRVVRPPCQTRATR